MNKLSAIKLLYLAFLPIGLILAALFVPITPALAGDTPEKTPKIEVMPSEGQVGTTIYVRIWDFTASKQVIVFFGSLTGVTSGTTIAAKETTDQSGYAVASFPIDILPGGRHVIVADDGLNRKTAYFTVMPKITLDKTSGCVGDTVIISGNGFAAKKPINVYLDDTKLTTCDADGKGQFSDIRFIVPSVSKGDHNIKVQDSEFNYVIAVYNVRQKMSISQPSAGVGTEVTINGSGFPPKDLTIYFDDKDVTSVQVATDGSFTSTIKVPPCGDGVHKIKVDDGVNRSYCEITVLPTLTINPTNGYVGMQLSVQGSGFRPGLPASVNYDNNKMDAPGINSQGNFSFNFRIPKSRAGAHTVAVTDGVNTQKITFTVESTPPVVPTLNLPADSSRVIDDAHFEWGAVSDPSGVTYVLEIASDAKFSKTLLSEANLTQNSYDLPEDKKVLASQKSPYYWRVKAIDGASNESAWSSVGSFYKGLTLDAVTSNMPGWTKFTLTGLGLVLLAFMFFWIGRTLKRAGNIDDSEFDSEAELNMDSAEWEYGSTEEWTQK